MCGIFALFNKSNIELSGQILQDISNSIYHRGPDDEGIVLINNKDVKVLAGSSTPQAVLNSSFNYSPNEALDSNFVSCSEVVLIHRRLSIVDLSAAGHQPYCDESGRYWLVYNGEIYNYVEIRDELIELGYSFSTEGDTEVLLKAYLQWGAKCQEHFNGMWSAIIYDLDEREYWISRDRMGVKPLYIYEDDNFLIFLSEVKSLLPMKRKGLIDFQANESVVMENLVFNASTACVKTEYLNVSRFPASCYGVFDFGNYKLKLLKKYWQIPTPNLLTQRHPFDEKEAQRLAKEYYELLKDAVRIRLRGDVAIGSALSGGLDSSSLVYLVNEVRKESGLNNRQHTFSNVYGGELKFMDESDNIKLLANKLDVESHSATPDPAEFTDFYRKRIFQRERSSLEASLQGAATYSLPRKFGVTITLDGQGADEQLAGYSGFWRNYAYSNPFQCFNEMGKTSSLNNSSFILIVMARCILPKFVFRNILCRLKKQKLSKYVRLAHVKLPKSDNLRKTLAIPDSFTLADSLRSSLDNGLRTLLWEDDIDGMTYSVESRQPFIDYRLIEFISKIPDCYKLHDGYTKYISRLAFDGKLPTEIVWCKDKKGFPGPVEYWIENNVNSIREWTDKTILNHSKFFNVKSSRCLDEIRVNDIDFYVRLLVTSIWYEEFFS